MAVDVVDVLTEDHREVEQWFQEYDGATTVEEKQRLTNNIVIELVRHAEAEEQFVYPHARKVLPNGEQLIEREISQHRRAEEIMNRMDGKDAGDPDFDSLMHELMGVIRTHFDEEQQGWFPQLRQSCSADDLQQMAKRVQAAKAVAPTRPHPHAPDRPPFNILVGVGVGVVDRARDLLTGRKQR